MANVETEQNKTLATQQEGGEQSASINLHEENLEALLNALSGAGTAALAPREAVPTPQPAAPVATPSAPVFATPAPIENISVDVQIQTPAAKASSAAQAFEEAKPLETSEAKPVDTSEAKPLETSAAPALQIAPVAPVQQDMSSKLALLSSIKQRRAITVRPDSGEVPAQPVQSSSPLPAEKPVANQQNANHQTVLRTLEQAKESTPAPTPRATTPQDILVEEKSALPAKKVWTSNSSTRTEETLREEKPAREQKLRRDERSRQEQKQEPLEQEPGNDDAPQAHVAQRQEAAKKAAIAKASAPNLPGSFAPARNYSALEALEAEKASRPAPKSFLTSKAGLGVIGGGLAAAALAAYLFMGHDSKPQNAATAGATGSTRTADATPVVSAVTDEKSADKSTANAAANQRPNTPAATSSSLNPNTQQAALAQPLASVQQKPGAVPTPPALPQLPQQVTPPPVVEAPKTPARKFAAPTPDARPVNATITDAPPALTPTATAPGAIALPARIAPLPPPPPPARTGAPPAAAPAQAAGTSGQPTQITVPGKTQATRLARQVLPVYPALAKTARVQGTVRFRVTVGTDGAVKSLTPLGGPLPLVQAATDAVRQWRYQPTLVDGKPVEVVTEIDVAFAL